MDTQYKEFQSVTIASSIDNLGRAESLVDDVCKNLNVKEDHYGNILIAVTEAVNNAINHGNANDPSKSVFIEVRESDDELKFAITD